jgi:cell division septal protein FtsQ
MYAKSRYTKPSARIKRRGQVKNFFRLIIKIAIPIFLVTILIIFLRADIVQINEIQVVGNQKITKTEIENLAHQMTQGSYLWLVPRSNILFFDEKALAQKIETAFPRIERVTVSKGLARDLEVSIIERQGDFGWCQTDNSCYLMSKNGLIFLEAKPEEIAGKLIFKGQVTGDPLWQNFASQKMLNDYLNTVTVLNGKQLQVSSIDVESADKSVFHTNLGDIFLNPEDDLALGVANALFLLEEVRTKNPTAKFNYIDARFGNKVFYKLAK